MLSIPDAECNFADMITFDTSSNKMVLFKYNGSDMLDSNICPYIVFTIKVFRRIIFPLYHGASSVSYQYF